jgi:hypothetical protein
LQWLAGAARAHAYDRDVGGRLVPIVVVIVAAGCVATGCGRVAFDVSSTDAARCESATGHDEDRDGIVTSRSTT